MGLLEGKVALITGGARGQGRAHAVVSAREGADVIIVDVIEQVETTTYKTARAEDLAETVRQVEALDRRILGIPADVRSQAQLDAAVAAGITEFGHIDILIANAGIWSIAPFWELTENQWEAVISVNLTGVWKSVKAVAPHMIERQSGSIVITSSTNGLEPAYNFAHYAASKYGVIGLMESVALELGRHGIRCNSIAPGAIKTRITNHPDVWDMIVGHPGATEQEADEGAHHTALLKGVGFMSPEVIANTALYLNSDLAATVTGVTIPVDAGHMILNGINMNPVK